MPTFRKIRRAEYEQDAGTHKYNDDRRTGTVTVYYSNGRRQEFEGIKRADFFEWERKHWDYKRPPAGVKTLAPEIVPEQEEIDAEIQQEEAEYQAMRARRRKMFLMANLALEKQIGTDAYRAKWGYPPSEQIRDEERQKDKRASKISRFSPDNPKWKAANDYVRAKIGEEEYTKRYASRTPEKG